MVHPRVSREESLPRQRAHEGSHQVKLEQKPLQVCQI